MNLVHKNRHAQLRTTEGDAPARPRWLPKTTSKFGALFYSAVGGVLSWLLVELPQHIVIVWH
jgi:hypothetical protein